MPFITPVKLKLPDASEVAALPWGPLRIRVAPLPAAVVLPEMLQFVPATRFNTKVALPPPPVALRLAVWLVETLATVAV